MKKYLLSFILSLLLAPSLLVSAYGQTPVYIDMDYIIVRPTDQGSIAIMHMTSVKNMLEQDFKGDGNSKAVLNVNIPKGATNLQVHDNSLGMNETDFGFFTTKLIPAKEAIVLPYSYWIEKDNKEIVLQYEYPVQAMQFLVPEGSGSLDIKDVEYNIEGPFEFEGQKYYGYNLKGIDPKVELKVTYDQNKQPSPEDVKPTATEETPVETEGADNSALGEVTHSAPVFHNPGHLRMWYQSPLRSWEPHVLLGVIVAIILGGVGYFSYFRWKGKVEEERRLSDKEEQAFLQLIAKRKAIMDKIVELEESYSGGQIEDDEYRKKMSAYKHHLLQVKLNLQKYTE
jgi:hypothetical protein